MRTTLAALASTVLIAVSAIALASIDIGPAVGSKIPAGFTALDKTGAQKGFADIAGKNGVVLVFVPLRRLVSVLQAADDQLADDHRGSNRARLHPRNPQL